jgi:glycopeptide antibiotics resistance protein
MVDQVRRLEPLLPVALAALALATLFTVWLSWFRARKGVPYRRALVASSLDVMLLALFVVTLILTLGPARTPAGRRLDLIPFRELQPRGFDRISAAVEMVGNVLLFAPLAFLVAIRFPALRSLHKIVALGIVSSVMLEGLQYVLNTGREASVTDVVLNAFGCALGYGVFVIASGGHHRNERGDEWRHPEGQGGLSPGESPPRYARYGS